MNPKLALRIIAATLIFVWAWKIYATWGICLGIGIAIILLF